jgi:carbonic anhydrase
MTRITPLLERNEQFARTYTPTPLGPPTTQLFVVACLEDCKNNGVTPETGRTYVSSEEGTP